MGISTPVNIAAIASRFAAIVFSRSISNSSKAASLRVSAANSGPDRAERWRSTASPAPVITGGMSSSDGAGDSQRLEKSAWSIETGDAEGSVIATVVVGIGEVIAVVVAVAVVVVAVAVVVVAVTVVAVASMVSASDDGPPAVRAVVVCRDRVARDVLVV